MVVRQNEYRRELREHMRGGEGTVEMLHFVSEKPKNCRVMAVIEFDEGDSIGDHQHSGETELYYILQGEATVTDGGEKVVVGVGDSVLTGNGATHSIQNTGKGMLRVLAVVIQE